MHFSRGRIVQRFSADLLPEFPVRQKDVDMGDTISVTDLKTITGALKDIKYVLGIRNETEKAIQEERLEALRREKKREEQQDDKTVTLIFKGMTDEEAQIAGEAWTG